MYGGTVVEGWMKNGRRGLVRSGSGSLELCRASAHRPVFTRGNPLQVLEPTPEDEIRSDLSPTERQSVAEGRVRCPSHPVLSMSRLPYVFVSLD